MENQTANKAPKYGKLLAQSIRTHMSENGDYKPSDFEKFVLNRGFYFENEETLKAGYDRSWKSRRGILITADEFIAEAELGGLPFSEEKKENAKKVYEILVELVHTDILACTDVYSYAMHDWCINSPEALNYYQVGESNYIVNSCDEKISREEAVIKINSEWGFEASRINVIGQPYYTSTDWQFIRFNCCGMSWLWADESLYKVYE